MKREKDVKVVVRELIQTTIKQLTTYTQKTKYEIKKGSLMEGDLLHYIFLICVRYNAKVKGLHFVVLFFSSMAVLVSW